MAKKSKEESKIGSKVYFWIFAVVIPLLAFFIAVYQFKCQIWGCVTCESGQVKIVNDIHLTTSEFNKLDSLDQVINQPITLSKIKEPAYSSLPLYYLMENQNFKSFDLSKVNIYVGPAGSGKSFIFKNLKKIFESEHDNYDVVSVSLSDMCKCSNSSCFGQNKKEQLYNTNSSWPYNFSMLPNVENFKLFSILRLNQFSGNSKKRVVLIDDCDEWHPDFTNNLVMKIFDTINSKKCNISFFLFGRPEGFRKLLNDTHIAHGSAYKVNYINNPVFKSEGDIKLRVKEYFAFKEGLDTLKIINTIFNANEIEKNFYISELRHLAWGNNLLDELNTGKSYSLYELKSNLFSAMLKRNQRSHCRPLMDDKLYFSLLIACAKKFASSVQSDGFFRVSSSDKISLKYCVNDQWKSVDINTQDLLEFSGIIDIKPINSINCSYKFHPFWIHSYLAKQEI